MKQIHPIPQSDTYGVYDKINERWIWTGEYPQLERILYNARKARENEDWEETENFYGQFLEYNSQDLEANFYFLYSKMAQSLLNYEFVKRKKAFEILIKYVSKLSNA